MKKFDREKVFAQRGLLFVSPLAFRLLDRCLTHEAMTYLGPPCENPAPPRHVIVDWSRNDMWFGWAPEIYHGTRFNGFRSKEHPGMLQDMGINIERPWENLDFLLPSELIFFAPATRVQVLNPAIEKKPFEALLYHNNPLGGISLVEKRRRHVTFDPGPWGLRYNEDLVLHGYQVKLLEPNPRWREEVDTVQDFMESFEQYRKEEQ